ncbi:MAG: recombinase RecJ, partial [Halobacteria archaeon]|nr:recombinase RecJ [Halobacteria archaeon]
MMLTDGDADGLAAVVLGKKAFDDFAYVHSSPNEFADDLANFADKVDEGATAFIVDLSLDSIGDDVASSLEILVDKSDEVYWFDHHQWDDSVVEALETLGIEVVIGESDEVCSADVTLSEL